MRIIGGQFKGYRFNPPSKIPARPTTDRAKESLINILISKDVIANKNCLDLFSGTGNIAFELASQGANFVTAIDVNFFSVEFINQIFNELKFVDFKVLKKDVFKWVKENNGLQFDFIFADPPYDHIGMSSLPELILTQNLLANGGLLVIEHRSSLNFNSKYLVNTRDYGQSRFSFFKNVDEV